MSYENAPSTRMLATHCAACARPLRDAASVEIGMGPDCREKYGYNVEIPETARMAVNMLIHAVAMNRDDRNAVDAACIEIDGLGLPGVAQIIRSRVFGEVKIEEMEGGTLAVFTPYNPDAVQDARTIPGRRWHKDRKANTFPATSRPQVWRHLAAFYPGAMGTGPKGPFVVPSSPAAAAQIASVKATAQLAA